MVAVLPSPLPSGAVEAAVPGAPPKEEFQPNLLISALRGCQNALPAWLGQPLSWTDLTVSSPTALGTEVTACPLVLSLYVWQMPPFPSNCSPFCSLQSVLNDFFRMKS